MNGSLRRSPRLSQQYPQHAFTTLPATSASSSTSITSQPSPTTDPTCSTPQQQHHSGLQLPSQFLGLPLQSVAPLPSPSASGDNPFFGTVQPQATFTMPEQGQGGSTMTHQGHISQASLQKSQTSTAQHHNSLSSNQRPNMTHSLQGQSQGPPPGFLAEAAKRAQMACLMRDLGDVTL